MVIGIYSSEAACLYGTSIYLTPEGKEVHVTCVMSEGEILKYNWADKVIIGPVTDYVRRGFIGSREHDEEILDSMQSEDYRYCGFLTGEQQEED